jgi:hypothetical protein
MYDWGAASIQELIKQGDFGFKVAKVLFLSIYELIYYL